MVFLDFDHLTPRLKMNTMDMSSMSFRSGEEMDTPIDLKLFTFTYINFISLFIFTYVLLLSLEITLLLIKIISYF